MNVENETATVHAKCTMLNHVQIEGRTFKGEKPPECDVIDKLAINMQKFSFEYYNNYILKPATAALENKKCAFYNSHAEPDIKRVLISVVFVSVHVVRDD